MAKHIGTVIQIIGPVLDIRFSDGLLPELLTAIEVPHGKETIVAEVAQHIGDNVVRCISMSSTDGLQRGAEAIDTGAPITVPVGDACLGRMFNLLGRPIDNKPAIKAKERWRWQNRSDYGANQQRRQAARRLVRFHRRWRAYPRRERPVQRNERIRRFGENRFGLWPDERTPRSAYARGSFRSDYGGVLPGCKASGRAAVYRQHFPLYPGWL